MPLAWGNDREAVTSGNLGPKFLIPFEFPTRPCSCEAVNESIGSTEPLAQHLANLLGEVAHEHDRLTGCRIRARAGEHCARQPAFPEQLLWRHGEFRAGSVHGNGEAQHLQLMLDVSQMSGKLALPGLRARETLQK